MSLLWASCGSASKRFGPGVMTTGDPGRSASGLGSRRDTIAEPRHESVEGELMSFAEESHESIGFIGVGPEISAVDSKRGIGAGKGSAFVAVDEGVSLRQALPKRRRFLDEVGVIARLRPE